MSCHRSTLEYSFRNFGWVVFQGTRKVEISRYTINESALVAHQFNMVVAPGRGAPLQLADACLAEPTKSELEKCMYFGGGVSCYNKFACR